jgi:hypothetical protein
MAGSSAVRQSKTILTRSACASEAEQSRLQTRIAATVSVSLCVQMKLTAFLELESVIRAAQRRTQLITKQVLATQFAPQRSQAE